MATLDQLTKGERDWLEHARKCEQTIMRAAGVQARQHGVHDPTSPAGHLVELYGLRGKKRDWREFGAVAFHLVATWPPDLAYIILYAMREVKPPLDYDPAPLVMKALEMLRHLRCEGVSLRVEMNGQAQQLVQDLDERARACSRVITRELSSVPLRWAGGIYIALDPEIKPFVQEELKRFNPWGAQRLLKGSRSWLMTGAGLSLVVRRALQAVYRVLFGNME